MLRDALSNTDGVASLVTISSQEPVANLDLEDGKMQNH